MEMEFKAMSVDELKDFLIEKEIGFSPYTQEEIDKALKEIEDLKKIQELGVKIYAQYTPDDEKILLDDLLKKGE